MDKIFGPSWKTSLGGAITAIGGVLVQIETPAWCKTVGQILLAAGPTLIGFVAADHKDTK